MKAVTTLPGAGASEATSMDGVPMDGVLGMLDYRFASPAAFEPERVLRQVRREAGRKRLPVALLMHQSQLAMARTSVWCASQRGWLCRAFVDAGEALVWAARQQEVYEQFYEEGRRADVRAPRAASAPAKLASPKETALRQSLSDHEVVEPARLPCMRSVLIH